MKPLSPRTILIVYILLAVGLGVSAFAIGMGSSLPPPTETQLVEEFKKTVSDPTLAKIYEDTLSEMRDRQRRLSDVTMNGFSTVLGALIGFLSASWAGSVRESKHVDSTDKPAA